MFNTVDTSVTIPTFLSGPDAYQSGPMLSALKVNWSTGNFLSLNFPFHRLRWFDFLKKCSCCIFCFIGSTLPEEKISNHCQRKQVQCNATSNDIFRSPSVLHCSIPNFTMMINMTSLFYNVLVLVIMCGSWSWPTSFPWSPCATHIPGEN